MRKISGRKVEKNIYNNIRRNKPKWWIFRFNENRRNSTPADIIVASNKFVALIEIKATSGEIIQKGNIRPSQREHLTSFAKLNKRHLSLLCFYFQKNRKYVLITIDNFIRLGKYRISFDNAEDTGIVIVKWKNTDRYMRKLKS